MESFRRITSKTVEDFNYIHKSDIFTNKLLQYFLATNWIHANPAKYNHSTNRKFREEVLSAYVSTEINNKAIAKLEEDIINPNVPYIFIMGSRGSGKTFFQNYFLNTKTKSLNEQNYTWIRVDHTKIYHYNLSTYSHNQRIDNIFSYIWSQLVFTYIRYRETHYSNTHSKPIYSNTTNQNGQKIFYEKDLIYSKLNASEIFSIDGKEMTQVEIDLFCQPIRDALHEKDSLKGKPFFHPYTEKLAKNILKQLKETNSKIALFIDGIDNIDFKHSVRKEIEHYLDPLIKEQDKHTYFDSIIITSRTELDLPLLLNRLFINRLPYDKEHLISTKGFLSYQKFWDTFFTKINQNPKKFFGLDYDNNRIRNFKTFIDSCQQIIKNYLTDVNISFNADLKISNPNLFCILKDLYDGDIREMKDGLLLSFIYIEEYIYNHNKYHDYNINFNTILHKRGYIVLEAIFKNGMKYAPDIRQKKLVPPYRNLGFTNLFNPTEEIARNSIIPPLLFVYILKYLSNNEFSSIEQMETFFQTNLKSKVFNNIKSYLPKAFEHLLEYNYVSYGRQDDNEKNDMMSITKKGLIVYHLIFKNIDIFHANIYYGTVYQNLDLNFIAFNPNGTKYITRTLENIAKYLYFLDILQFDMLKNDDELSISNNDLYINFYTDELKKTYKNLYHLEANNISLSNPVKLFIDNKILSDLPKCLSILKNKTYKDILSKIIKNNSSSSLDERVKLIYEIIYLRTEDENTNQCLQIIDDSKAISKYLNFNEKNERNILNYLENYKNSVKKYFYIKKLCASIDLNFLLD